MRFAPIVVSAICAAACEPPPSGVFVEPADAAPAVVVGEVAEPDIDVDPAWPPLEPLPEAFDLPPWITMPAPGVYVVSWRTPQPSVGTVRWVTSRGASGALSSRAATELHHIALIDLPPATAVSYQVDVNDGEAARRGVFVTPGAQRWRFVHLAEFHAPSDADHVAELAPVIRAFRPHLVIESGDMVDTGSNFEHWRSYLRTSAPWISNVVILPAHSNHANGFLGNPHVAALFELPNNERWYTTRWGQVEVFSLDSTFDSADSPDVQSVEVAWLETAAFAAHDGFNDPRFVVAAWHYPACSSHYAGRAGQRAWVMANFIDTFRAAGGVDLVLVGHDKYYERSNIREIVHVMANAGRLAPSVAGNNEPDCEPIHTDLEVRTVGLYRVTRDAIEADIVTAQGELIDRFAVR